MRNPNTQCGVCDKPLYRRPYEFKEGISFCCVGCRGALYKDNPKIWLDNLTLGYGWNKGKTKANGDNLPYGRPRKAITKQRISQKLKGLAKSPQHNAAVSRARLALFDRIGRKIKRSAKIDGRYQRWRKAVLKHDKYICQHCGSKEELQTHHIKPYSRFPELVYDIDNGLTLCVECHRKTDSWGYKKALIIKK